MIKTTRASEGGFSSKTGGYRDNQVTEIRWLGLLSDRISSSPGDFLGALVLGREWYRVLGFNKERKKRGSNSGSVTLVWGNGGRR